MTDVRRWARTTPPNRNPRHVLAELDYLQLNGEVPHEARSAALDDLVRRGVIDAEAADVARSAPEGRAAESWDSTKRGAAAAAAASRPRTPRPTRPQIEADAPDPGGVIGSLLVVAAPVLPLVALVGVLSPLAVMWLATIALFAGVIVLAVTGGRGNVSAIARRGRLSPAGLTVLASIAVLSPLATVAVGLADIDASKYFGAFVGYQAMMAVGLFALAAIARRQERGGHPRARG